MVANDIKLHLPSAVGESTYLGISFDDVTLPIKVFAYQGFEMRRRGLLLLSISSAE